MNALEVVADGADLETVNLEETVRLPALLALARRVAKRNQLTSGDTEDYAIEFAEWVLLDARRREYNAALLTTCAGNLAKNFKRKVERTRIREDALTNQEARLGAFDAAFQPQQESNDLSAPLLMAELRAILGGVLGTLPGGEQVLWDLVINRGHTSGDLGFLVRKPSGTIRRELFLVRKHIREMLLTLGHTEAELRKYLTSPRHTPTR